MSNRLTKSQAFDVALWLKDNKEHALKRTDEQLAEEATIRFGYEITKGNIDGCRDTVGIEKKRGGNSGSRVTPLRHIARCVLDLQQRAGVELDPKLQQLAEHGKNATKRDEWKQGDEEQNEN